MINTIILVLVLFLSTSQSEYMTGWTSHYDENVMSWQIDYHGLEPPCEDCAVAMEDCKRIGQLWQIRKVDKKEHAWIPVVVADCAGKDAIQDNGKTWMENYGVVAELSHTLAEQLNAIGTSVEIEMVRTK